MDMKIQRKTFFIKYSLRSVAIVQCQFKRELKPFKSLKLVLESWLGIENGYLSCLNLSLMITKFVQLQLQSMFSRLED